MSVSGPYSRTVGTSGNSAYVKSYTWYRQSKPRIRRLAYSMNELKVTSGDKYNPGVGWPTDSRLLTLAINSSYNHLSGQLATFGQLAVTFLEGEQAISMIASRAKQLMTFTKALKKGRIDEAANALGFRFVTDPKKRLRNLRRENARKAKSQTTDIFFVKTPIERLKPIAKPKGLKKGKPFANNFLEFHFGWAPLIQDIGDAVNTLQGGVPPSIVRGRSTQHTSWSYHPDGNGVQWYDVTQKVRVQQIATVRINNPNLFLANQLGFVNPLSIAWELVPFSFVVDWFANVGQVLGSLTEFFGIDIIEPATTVLVNGTVDRKYYYSAYPRVDPYQTGTYVNMRRTAGLSKPSLTLKPFKGFSVTRGVTAISLLLQQLR